MQILTHFEGVHLPEGGVLWFPMMLPGMRAGFFVSVCWAPIHATFRHPALIAGDRSVLGESKAPEEGEGQQRICWKLGMAGTGEGICLICV